MLVEFEEFCHTLAFSHGFDGEAVGGHHGAVVVLVGNNFLLQEFGSSKNLSYLCGRINHKMTEEHILEYEILEEENDSMLVAEGYSWRGFADELQELHYLKGASFINQLKLIIYYGEFHPVEGEANIYSAVGEESEDYENLLNAAR